MRILIADDHIVLRQGLKALLDSNREWEVVAEASDGFEVIPLVEEHKPDILVLDLSMPNLGGVETLNRLSKLDCGPPVLVLSAHIDERSVGEAVDAGAKGYIPKSSSSEELEFAISSVAKGQTYISPSVCDALLSYRSSGAESSPLASLSSREREVLKLLAEGKPNRDVAKILHISPRTIDSHRANIMKKLDVSSNAELVSLAIKQGLVD